MSGINAMYNAQKMKRFVFALLPFFLAAFSSWPSTPSATTTAMQDLFDHSHKPSDVFQVPHPPFELEVEFSSPSKTPLTGRLLLRWKGPGQWWSRVDYGPFQQIMIRNGEMEYANRNVDYTPEAVKDTFQLLNIRADDFGPWHADKQKNRTRDGVPLTCIRGEMTIGSQHIPHDFCFETASRELRTEEWDFAGAQENDYDSYFDFDGLRIPKNLRRIVNGSVILSAKVVRLQGANFDDSWLTPATGALKRRRCPGIKPALPTGPHPTLTEGLPHAGEKVTVTITVLADGSVGSVSLVGASDPARNKPFIDAFKHWKFKPALCGNEPVDFDLDYVIWSTR